MSINESKIPDTTLLCAVDFGTGSKLCIHGPCGPIDKGSLDIPKVYGGKTPRDEFIGVMTALMKRYDVVVESPTIGASGAEVEDVRTIVAGSVRKLYTIQARAVKNYRKDHGMAMPSRNKDDEKDRDESWDAEAARILYTIATTQPMRLRLWKESYKLVRKYSSVRPMDKRGYRCHESERLMKNLPPFRYLPMRLRGTAIELNGDYCRPIAIPFAQAMEEPYWREDGSGSQRDRFMKVLGLYDHGFGCHYRRMTVEWMQEEAKILAGVTKMEEVSREVRKQAQKNTTSQIRFLFHLAKRWVDGDYPMELVPKPDVPPQPRRLD